MRLEHRGPAFYEKACAVVVEGLKAVSKRIDAPYTPRNDLLLHTIGTQALLFGLIAASILRE
ncbi:MAG: hypothetical protein KGM92_05940 [Acidobacteriota bacterium]|nr:hypothetical protein [Acidobacteriota bacterium]